jgi:hypothetical protein
MQLAPLGTERSGAVVDVDPSSFVRPQPVAASEAPAGGKPRDSHIWAAGAEPSFHDVLDAINPLHQIPIVSTLYENLTGDRIGIVPRIIGGALFGGPIGMAAAMATGAFEDATGKTPGETVLAALGVDGGKDGGSEPTAVAIAEARGSRDGGGSLAGPAASATVAPAQTVLMAEAGRGSDRDPTVSIAPAPAPAAAPQPPVLAENTALTPRQHSEQLAMEAAHQARFGRPSGQPLLQQAAMMAGAGPARSPTPAFGASNQRVLPASYALTQTKPAAAAALQPQPAVVPPVAQALPDSVPDDSVSKAMMKALDKYEQMVKQRQNASAPQPGTQLDISQ